MDDECHRIPIEKTVVGDDDDLPELIDGDVGQSSQPVSAVNIQSKAASKQLDADGFVEPTSKGRKRKHRGDATNSAMDVDVVADVQVERAAKRKRFQGEYRRIAVPPHRYTPLKQNWLKIFEVVAKHMELQIRFNVRSRTVEIRKDDKIDQDVAMLQKAADFVKAFITGFDVDDALALVRLDDLFIETFEINDVKPLKGEHLSRAIGRIAGKDGRTKFAIENATKTRIVLADSKIHLLGSFNNIKAARTAICNLILGSPPSKVYGSLRSVANRLRERF